MLRTGVTDSAANSSGNLAFATSPSCCFPFGCIVLRHTVPTGSDGLPYDQRRLGSEKQRRTNVGWLGAPDVGFAWLLVVIPCGGPA